MIEKPIEEFIGKIHNMDCIDLMKEMPEDSIDLVITSPPYNVGIKYDTWDDKKIWVDYEKFAKGWLSGVYRVLKKDGRIALNVPYEINVNERGGRKFIVAEYWRLMQEIGFNFRGIVDLVEVQAQRVKLTAWGSWLSPSAPYIYNPKECVLIACKKEWKKEKKGISYFTDSDEHKKEFKELVYGMWKYRAETKGKTQANFSESIPVKAIKILSFEDDIVFDPFTGSGTTGFAVELLGKRKFIGCEISKKYVDVAYYRIDMENRQQKMELKDEKDRRIIG